MKKVLSLCLLLSTCLLVGCTKNYKTVEEYETAMKEVKKANSNYTMEVRQELGSIGMTYKTHIKGDKWKTETSINGGASYYSTTLYDGNELLQYSQGSPYATINPASSMLKDFDSEEEKVMSLAMVNPPINLVYWENSFSYSDSKRTFGNTKENKNGFECRMVIGNNEESCVSDKYGVAVYRKLKGHDNSGDIVYNLIKIDTAEIPDSEFELPAGVKKMDFDSMLQDLDRKMKSMKFDY